MIEFEDYRLVPSTWRKAVEPRESHRARNRRAPRSPLAVDLLRGKTVFVWGVPNRKRSFVTLYRLAANYRKKLHVHQHADIDSDIMDGYLLWMD